jgi:hypothetical protein
MDLWHDLQSLPFEAKASIVIPTMAAVAVWAITEIRERAKGSTPGTKIHGSVIFSHGQMGGQIAHSIVNAAPPPRLLGEPAVEALIAALQRQPPIEAEIKAVVGNEENTELADQLKSIVEAAGWTVGRVRHGIARPVQHGIVINTPTAIPALQTFGDFLLQAGIQVKGVLDEDITVVTILVGPP